MEKTTIESVDVCEARSKISTITDVNCPLEGKEHKMQ
jgi:hypothetical protein